MEETNDLNDNLMDLDFTKSQYSSPTCSLEFNTGPYLNKSSHHSLSTGSNSPSTNESLHSSNFSVSHSTTTDSHYNHANFQSHTQEVQGHLTFPIDSSKISHHTSLKVPLLQSQSSHDHFQPQSRDVHDHHNGISSLGSDCIVESDVPLHENRYPGQTGHDISMAITSKSQSDSHPSQRPGCPQCAMGQSVSGSVCVAVI